MRLYEKRQQETDAARQLLAIPTDIRPEDFQEKGEYFAVLYRECSRLNPGTTFAAYDPGAPLTHYIDLFIQDGVVPDFIDADLGDDNDVPSVSASGRFQVDPFGNVRSDLIEMREAGMFSDIDGAIASAEAEIEAEAEKLYQQTTQV